MKISSIHRETNNDLFFFAVLLISKYKLIQSIKKLKIVKSTVDLALKERKLAAAW